MNVSWGDHLEAWDGDDAMDRPGKILRCAERWRREFGAGAVYWREMKTWSKFRICFSAPGAPPRRVFEDYEQHYGVDMMRRNFDLEPWRRLRGEGVTQFLRELRSALDARGMELGIGVPAGDYMGPPLGNLYLDWRTWVREKLLDDLVIDQVAVRCPSFWGLLWPKHQGYGYLVNDEDHYGLKGVGDLGEPSYWSIPLVKGSPEYQGAMERLYGAIRDDYGPRCTRHGCRLHVARMWAAHDPEENARLLDTEGVAGLVIGSFGAVVDRRCGGVRPDVATSA